MFPLVFRNELKKRNIEFELDLFFIYSCKQAFDPNTNVYAVSDLETMYLQKKYDAFFVGGGEIIHFYSFKHRYNQEEKTYPIFGVWVTPSIVSKKYGVPLFWNCPGVPFDFSKLIGDADRQRVKRTIQYSIKNGYGCALPIAYTNGDIDYIVEALKQKNKS